MRLPNLFLFILEQLHSWDCSQFPQPCQISSTAFHTAIDTKRDGQQHPSAPFKASHLVPQRSFWMQSIQVTLHLSPCGSIKKKKNDVQSILHNHKRNDEHSMIKEKLIIEIKQIAATYFSIADHSALQKQLLSHTSMIWSFHTAVLSKN